jgi:hypothetical protein
MKTSPVDLGAMVMALWTAGPVAQAFVVTALAALAALGAALFRSKLLLTLNTDLFLQQVDKLIAASNADRAVKLSSAHDGPVARLTRAGLAVAVERGHHRSPSEQARRAREEMERQLPQMMAFALKGLWPARLLSAGACALGVAALLGPAAGTVLLSGSLIALLVLGLLLTVLEQQRYARDLQSVIETVSGSLRVAPHTDAPDAEPAADFFANPRG